MNMLYINKSMPSKNPHSELTISKLGCQQHFGGIGTISKIKPINFPKTKNTFVHVFWSKPLLNSTEGRWNISSQYELMLPLCALSLACLKFFNQKVILITDTKGKELLESLDYDEIITILDDYNVQNEFWAAGKIAALKYMPSDAILIDTDLFLYDGALIDIINQHDVVCSHQEVTKSYTQLLEIGIQYFPWLNNQNIDLNISSNTGILKCNKPELKNLFIDKYYESIEIINNTLDLMGKIKQAGKGSFCPDLLIEQFNFHTICSPFPLIILSKNYQNVNGISHPLAFEKYLHMPLIIEVLQTQFPNYYTLVENKWNELNFKLNIV